MIFSRPKPPQPGLAPGCYEITTGKDAWQEWARSVSLLKQLTRRHLADRYRASHFGFLWSVFSPILMMGVYAFVFRFVFRAEVPGVPFTAYFIVGYLGWNFFSVAVGNSAASVVSNVYLLERASFPRFLLPLSAVLSNVLNYLVTLPLMLVFLLILGVYPGWSLLWLPAALLLLMWLAGGVGFLAASFAPFFRDLLHLLDIIMMAWFFATPVVYPMTMVSDRIQQSNGGISEMWMTIYQLNPMVGAVSFLHAIFLNQPIPWDNILVSCAWAVVILALGVWAYARCAPHFSEV